MKEVHEMAAGYVVGAVTALLASRAGGVVILGILAIVALLSAVTLKAPTVIGNAFGVMSAMLYLFL